MAHSRFLALMGIVVLASACGVPGWSEPVLVVKDKDITPYNQAISGLKESCQAAVKELDVEKVQQAGQDVLSVIKAASPSAIVTLGRKSSEIVCQGIQDIPTVVCMDPAPERALASKNAAVIPLVVPASEQFKAMMKVVSKAKRVGVVYLRNDLDAIVEEAKKDATTLGLSLSIKKIAKSEEMPSALREMIGSIDAIWVLPDQDIINSDSQRTLILISVESGLPLLVYSRDFVRSGALLAVIHDYQDTGRKAGDLVKSCLTGASLSDLKPAFPATMWAVNMTMAERLKIPISEEVKKRAQVE